MANNLRCKRCVMDDTADGFELNSDDVCNYCEEFLAKSIKRLETKQSNLTDVIRAVKKARRKNEYDCVIGVSGGIDSSYLLAKTIEFGLKPLAVHMDNGWNSELAQNNISELVTKLNVDFISHVIYWPDYRNLMKSFFNADVIDIELLYDNAALAVNYGYAKKFKIKNIIAGTNESTEGFRVPSNWVWLKYDSRNIKSIAKSYNVKIKSSDYPMISTLNLFQYKLLGFKWISLLDFLKYEKQSAQDYLIKNFSFKPYPYKHYESIFTRFYQGFILPVKFGVDKRKLHLSNLIMAGQMTRVEALETLEKNPYVSDLELKNDTNYFLKKMNWDEKDLNRYLNRKPKSHSFYKNAHFYWKNMARVKKFLNQK